MGYNCGKVMGNNTAVYQVVSEDTVETSLVFMANIWVEVKKNIFK